MTTCSGCDQKFPRLNVNQCNKCLGRKPGLGPPELEQLKVCLLNLHLITLETSLLSAAAAMCWMWGYVKQHLRVMQGVHWFLS